MNDLEEVKEKHINHKLLTIIGRAKHFLQRVSLEDFTVTTINIQSFASHSPDVSTDPVLASADILALTGTWMDNCSSRGL
jgi:hypothetical protein